MDCLVHRLTRRHRTPSSAGPCASAGGPVGLPVRRAALHPIPGPGARITFAAPGVWSQDVPRPPHVWGRWSPRAVRGVEPRLPGLGAAPPPALHGGLGRRFLGVRTPYCATCRACYLVLPSVCLGSSPGPGRVPFFAWAEPRRACQLGMTASVTLDGFEPPSSRREAGALSRVSYSVPRLLKARASVSGEVSSRPEPSGQGRPRRSFAWIGGIEASSRTAVPLAGRCPILRHLWWPSRQCHAVLDGFLRVTTARCAGPVPAWSTQMVSADRVRPACKP